MSTTPPQPPNITPSPLPIKSVTSTTIIGRGAIAAIVVSVSIIVIVLPLIILYFCGLIPGPVKIRITHPSTNAITISPFHTNQHTDSHTNQHTNIHTDQHTNIHTDQHTNQHTNIHTNQHTNIHTNQHTNIHTNQHTNIHTNLHTNVLTHPHTNIHTNVATHPHTNIHTHQHTNIQTHPHTNIQTHHHTNPSTHFQTHPFPSILLYNSGVTGEGNAFASTPSAAETLCSTVAPRPDCRRTPALLGWSTTNNWTTWPNTYSFTAATTQVIGPNSNIIANNWNLFKSGTLVNSLQTAGINIPFNSVLGGQFIFTGVNSGGTWAGTNFSCSAWTSNSNTLVGEIWDTTLNSSPFSTTDCAETVGYVCACIYGGDLFTDTITHSHTDVHTHSLTHSPTLFSCNTPGAFLTTYGAGGTIPLPVNGTTGNNWAYAQTAPNSQVTWDPISTDFLYNYYDSSNFLNIARLTTPGATTYSVTPSISVTNVTASTFDTNGAYTYIAGTTTAPAIYLMQIHPTTGSIVATYTSPSFGYTTPFCADLTCVSISSIIYVYLLIYETSTLGPKYTVARVKTTTMALDTSFHSPNGFVTEVLTSNGTNLTICNAPVILPRSNGGVSICCPCIVTSGATTFSLLALNNIDSTGTVINTNNFNVIGLAPGSASSTNAIALRGKMKIPNTNFAIVVGSLDPVSTSSLPSIYGFAANFDIENLVLNYSWGQNQSDGQSQSGTVYWTSSVSLIQGIAIDPEDNSAVLMGNNSSGQLLVQKVTSWGYPDSTFGINGFQSPVVEVSIFTSSSSRIAGNGSWIKTGWANEVVVPTWNIIASIQRVYQISFCAAEGVASAYALTQPVACSVGGQAGSFFTIPNLSSSIGDAYPIAIDSSTGDFLYTSISGTTIRATRVSLSGNTIYNFTTTNANFATISVAGFDFSGNAYIGTNNNGTTMNFLKITPTGTVSYTATVSNPGGYSIPVLGGMSPVTISGITYLYMVAAETNLYGTGYTLYRFNTVSGTLDTSFNSPNGYIIRTGLLHNVFPDGFCITRPGNGVCAVIPGLNTGGIASIYIENFSSTGVLGISGNSYSVAAVTTSQQVMNLYNGKQISGTNYFIVCGYAVSNTPVQDYGWAICLNMETAAINSSWGNSGIYILTGATDTFNGWGGVAEDSLNQSSYLLGWTSTSGTPGPPVYTLTSARFWGTGAIDVNYGYQGIAYTAPPNGWVQGSFLGNGAYIFKTYGGEISVGAILRQTASGGSSTSIQMNICAQGPGSGNLVTLGHLPVSIGF